VEWGSQPRRVFDLKRQTVNQGSRMCKCRKGMKEKEWIWSKLL